MSPSGDILIGFVMDNLYTKRDFRFVNPVDKSNKQVLFTESALL